MFGGIAAYDLMNRLMTVGLTALASHGCIPGVARPQTGALDACCGDRGPSFSLRRLVPLRVTGLDFTPAMLMRAARRRARAPRSPGSARVRRRDLLELPFDGRFAAVTVGWGVAIPDVPWPSGRWRGCGRAGVVWSRVHAGARRPGKRSTTSGWGARALGRVVTGDPPRIVPAGPLPRSRARTNSPPLAGAGLSVRTDASASVPSRPRGQRCPLDASLAVVGLHAQKRRIARGLDLVEERLTTVASGTPASSARPAGHAGGGRNGCAAAHAALRPPR
jgi:hypothetical protein